MDSAQLLGRSPEQLTLPECAALRGKWIALEIYSPATLPLRRIEAVGASAADCMRQLARRGLDPRGYEYNLASR